MPMMIHSKKKKKEEAVFVVLHYLLQNVWIPNPRSNFSTHWVDEFVCACLKKVPIFRENDFSLVN